ncbi:MAG TPA: ATP-dependent sacrificial sulfur transferase LarE [Planctomycetes bacterium]|nr:ATP-dependent sacrificial sulfur transferase LarE [Planctomycetota bacterium]
MDIEAKYNSLREILVSFGKVLIAYSGGVDSTFLLKSAVDTLGADNVLACIGVSASLAAGQHKQAVEMAQSIGANIREIPLSELDDDAYSANKADRCFHCKSHLYGLLTKIAEAEQFEAVLCGCNFDDKDDFRPGNRAAKVFGIRSPLLEAKLTKADIRKLSRRLNLATADLPASPCLASRLSYGLEITEQRLKQVEEAEGFIRSLGFLEFRVRHHGDIARIEVPTEQIEKIISKQMRSKIIEKLKDLGFKYVTVDLQGFRSGSLNDALTEQEKQQSQKIPKSSF